MIDFCAFKKVACSHQFELKFLAELSNIPIKLASHIGRHTARMLLAEAGIIEQAVIKSFMGHSNQKDIDSTYFIVTTKHLLKAKNHYVLKTLSIIIHLMALRNRIKPHINMSAI